MSDLTLHTTARQSFVVGAHVPARSDADAGQQVPAEVAAAAAAQMHNGAVAMDVQQMRAHQQQQHQQQRQQQQPQQQRQRPSGSPSSSPNSSKSASERRSGQKDGGVHSIARSSPSDSFTGKYAVDVRGATHSYDKKKDVLHQLDLQIEPGQIYGLLGPSGCGL